MMRSGSTTARLLLGGVRAVGRQSPQAFLLKGSSFFHSSAIRPTTVLCVRKNGKVCMMGDGMVSAGSSIVKPNVTKIRKLKDGTLVGFAGSTADAFTLLERLEGKLDEYPGQLTRSCVELAKGWRTDKYLRRLEASLIVADASVSLNVSGLGDVLDSHDGILAVGSGGNYAIAAARGLMEVEGLTAEEITRKAMEIAASMDIYTNDTFKMEVIEEKDGEAATIQHEEDESTQS